MFYASFQKYGFPSLGRPARGKSGGAAGKNGEGDRTNIKITRR